MKTRVVTRAFYEDAYLDFFIQYYLALGFDSIVILKADGVPFPLDKYPADRVQCIQVANDGNGILRKHKSYYMDNSYDWILNVDADEFLVIDMEKFPNIQAYLEDITTRLNPDQIMFWWVCINKLTCWSPDRQEPVMLTDYINGAYPLDFYKYVKCMARPNRVCKREVTCHFYRKPKKVNPETKPFVNIIDGQITKKINTSLPITPPVKNTFCDGFILHLNSRSLTNGLTKSLVTTLHVSKHFKNIDAFRKFTEKLPDTPDKITDQHRLTLESHMDGKIQNPIRIKTYGKEHRGKVDLANARRLLDNLIKHVPLVTTTPVMSIQAEWDIMDKLALDKKINPTKLRTLLLGTSKLNNDHGVL